MDPLISKTTAVTAESAGQEGKQVVCETLDRAKALYYLAASAARSVLVSVRLGEYSWDSCGCDTWAALQMDSIAALMAGLKLRNYHGKQAS